MAYTIEVEAIIDHRPAEVGPEALNIEYLIKLAGFDRAGTQHGIASRVHRYRTAPSIQLVTTGRRGYQRNQPASHNRAVSASKTVASRSFSEIL